MWLTCAVDGADHAVSDAAFLAAQGGDGRFEAMCHATVWASSLSAPPASRCETCESAAGEAAASTDRRGGGGGLWSRLVPRASA